jgi:polyhydroxyalkanoate synthesis regulator phasin
VKQLVESTQSKSSEIIYEFNEVQKPPPESLQKIPTLPQEEMESEAEEELSLLYGVDEGMEKLKDSFLKLYELQLISWMSDVSNGVLTGSEYIRSSINNIKTTLTSGLEDAQRIFDKSFSDISNLFMKNIRVSVDLRLENQIELKNDIKAINEEHLNSLFIRLEKEIRDVTNDFEEKITNIKKELEKIALNNNSIQESLIQTNDILNTVYEETDKLSDTVIQHIENSSKPFESKLMNELEDFFGNMTPNKEIYAEIEELIERLQRVISDLRQIK